MLIDMLMQKISRMGSPVVVGLDPQLYLCPSFLKEKFFTQHGRAPVAVSEIFYEFNREIIDNVCEIVPCVKLQIAMYEMYGPRGLECYIKTAEYAKQKGLIVIGDIKRGDITVTAAAYSSAHIGEVKIEGQSHAIFKSDFVTFNPYMGYDGIEPFLQDCKAHDKGLFVLVKTSNPSSGDIQDVITKDGQPLYAHVGGLVNKWGSDIIGENGFSQIGAVVGATYSQTAKELREIMPKTLFLVPGYGAQGAQAKDLAGFFTKDKKGVIVNSSRGIIGAYQLDRYKQFGEKNYGHAAKQAALDMIQEIRGIVL